MNRWQGGGKGGGASWRISSRAWLEIVDEALSTSQDSCSLTVAEPSCPIWFDRSFICPWLS